MKSLIIKLQILRNQTKHSKDKTGLKRVCNYESLYCDQYRSLKKKSRVQYIHRSRKIISLQNSNLQCIEQFDLISK